MINILGILAYTHSWVWLAGISSPEPSEPRTSLSWTSGTHFTAWKLSVQDFLLLLLLSQGNFLYTQWAWNGTFWKGINYSVFIFFFIQFAPRAKSIVIRDHKHYFDWLTSLISKTWKTENVSQVAKKVLLEFTDMIASGNNIKYNRC